MLKKACWIGTELLITLRIIILSGYVPCYHKSVKPFTDGRFDVRKLSEYYAEHCPFVQYSARLGLWVSVAAQVRECLERLGVHLGDPIPADMGLCAAIKQFFDCGLKFNGDLDKFSFSPDGSRVLATLFEGLIDTEVSNDNMLAAAYARVSTTAKESDAHTYTPSP